jgi:hypothetical protein
MIFCRFSFAFSGYLRTNIPQSAIHKSAAHSQVPPPPKLLLYPIRHIVHRNTTALPHSLASLLQSNRLDLNRYALRQLVDGDACPGWLVCEPLLIFAIHLREVGHVRDEDLWRWWHQWKVEKGNWPGRQHVTAEARGQDWSCSCKHPQAAL